ncbi:hypothetical protein DERP_003068 [Dermatophagoides pteronyssinus]|uniref:Uncharacterized protein n=1 Tax=Dermatophagoides pteronyssinus TaxID=6956 RepID=A0ABQ8JIF0_DERPT|nr:hypothetical protein DERP_003068 [Dermatophagoides pteronyssinus]
MEKKLTPTLNLIKINDEIDGPPPLPKSPEFQPKILIKQKKSIESLDKIDPININNKKEEELIMKTTEKQSSTSLFSPDNETSSEEDIPYFHLKLTIRKE